MSVPRPRSPSSSRSPRGDVRRTPINEVVRRGWDRLSFRYRPPSSRSDCFGHTRRDYEAWLRPLSSWLPPNARVLDLGCGSGDPAARWLARSFRVVGVDVSEVQVRRARALVPTGRFRRADMTEVRFPPGSFQAVIALYSIIHVPLRRQRALLRRIQRWLSPGGVFLAVLGHEAWTGRERNWLGSGVEMYWSHADARTYRRWLTELGFRVTRQRFVREGDGGHELFVARTPR